MAKVGRPTKMTPETIAKLEEVFAVGGSDREAIFYADISESLFYEYQKNHPEFMERKNILKEEPILKARREIIKGLDNNPEFSLKFLERKRKKEFSLRQEHTGADGKDLPQPILNVQANNSDEKDTEAN